MGNVNIKEDKQFLIKQLQNSIQHSISAQDLDDIDKVLIKNGYYFEKILGEGSQAVIISAYSIKHNQRVAIKCFKKSYINIDQYNKEIESLDKLKGKNYVLGFLDTISDQNHDIFLVVTELCDETLEQIMKQKFTERQIYALTYQLLRGLLELSLSGILHCDLKPENIFYNRKKEQFVIGDYGLATMLKNPLQQETSSQSLEGNFKYKPYEVVYKQKPYTPKIDIFSLGVILTEVVLNKDIDNFSIVTIKEKGLQSLQSELRKFPCQKYISEILESMVQKSPNDRKSPYELLCLLQSQYQFDEKDIKELFRESQQQGNDNDSSIIDSSQGDEESIFIGSTKQDKQLLITKKIFLGDNQDQSNLQSSIGYAQVSQQDSISQKSKDQNYKMKINQIKQINFISNPEKLQTLQAELNSQEIKGQDFFYFIEKIKSCKKLKGLILQLNDNDIQYQGVNYISGILSGEITLNKLVLELNNNKIKAQGAYSLSEGLKASQSLRRLKLCLNNNEIHEIGAKTISQGIQQCQKLKSLTMCLKDNIIESGMNFIIESIRSLKLLTYLNLDVSRNGINYQSVFQFKNQFNLFLLKTLVLDLSNNRIGTAGATAVSDGIKSCYQLSSLRLFLGNNSIDQNGYFDIIHSISSLHDKLVHLEFVFEADLEILQKLGLQIQLCTHLKVFIIVGVWKSKNEQHYSEGLQQCCQFSKLITSLPELRHIKMNIQYTDSDDMISYILDKQGENIMKEQQECIKSEISLLTENVQFNTKLGHEFKAILDHFYSLTYINMKLKNNSLNEDNLLDGLTLCSQLSNLFKDFTELESIFIQIKTHDADNDTLSYDSNRQGIQIGSFEGKELKNDLVINSKSVCLSNRLAEEIPFVINQFYVLAQLTLSLNVNHKSVETFCKYIKLLSGMKSICLILQWDSQFTEYECDQDILHAFKLADQLNGLQQQYKILFKITLEIQFRFLKHTESFQKFQFLSNKNNGNSEKQIDHIQNKADLIKFEQRLLLDIGTFKIRNACSKDISDIIKTLIFLQNVNLCYFQESQSSLRIFQSFGYLNQNLTQLTLKTNLNHQISSQLCKSLASNKVLDFLELQCTWEAQSNVIDIEVSNILKCQIEFNDFLINHPQLMQFQCHICFGKTWSVNFSQKEQNHTEGQAESQSHPAGIISFYLNFKGSKVGQDGLISIRNGLQSIQNIQNLTLYLDENNINSEEISMVSQWIQKPHNILHLQLSLIDNKICEYGAKKISEVLQQEKNLIRLELNLSRNKIKSEGAKFIGEGLKCCTQLTHLKLILSHNNILSKTPSFFDKQKDYFKKLTTKGKILLFNGACGIGEGIIECNQLVSLDIDFSFNKINYEVVSSISQGITICKQLQSVNLDFQSNQIRSEGAITLINALKQCTKLSLVHLKLSKNKIGSKGAELICNQIHNLQVSEELNLNIEKNNMTQKWRNMLENKSYEKIFTQKCKISASTKDGCCQCCCDFDEDSKCSLI